MIDAEFQRFLAGPLLRAARVAILGIGNELNGDDAAGVLVARGLKDLQVGPTPPRWSERVLIFEAGAAPENFTGPLRRFQPGLVVMVDAAEMSEPPGAVLCFDGAEAEGMSGSTHTLPPSLLAQFLVRELGCRVALIGIQPQTLDFGEPCSPPVQEAIREVTGALARGLG